MAAADPRSSRRRHCLAGIAAALGAAALPCPAAPRRRVCFVAQDFRNTGLAAVYRSVEEACAVLGWHFTVENGRGDTVVNRQLVRTALRDGADGVVLGGIDAAEVADLIAEAAASRRSVVVGWHAVSTLKASPHLFANVTTALADVASMSVELVERTMTDGSRKAGVLIINDSRFSLATLKTQLLREAVLRSPRCELLAVEDVKISTAAQDIPRFVPSWVARHGRRLTHIVAINDIYFESITYPLRDLGRSDIKGISAGDGSPSALGRIATGRATQVATIAEPLGLQGWQIADELVRAFAGQPRSGRVVQPIAITTAFMREHGSRAIDDDLPYRREYRELWRAVGLLGA